MDEKEKEDEITGYDADGKPIHGDRAITVGDQGEGGDKR